jgi:hypothetical protein
MSQYHEVVESIKVLAAKYQAIVQLANFLERFGSLEDSERDIKARVSRASEEATAAEATLLTANNAVKEAEDRARNLVPNAEAHAARIVA